MLTYDLEMLEKKQSVDKYVDIMKKIKVKGFKLSDAFKNTFNGFYRIRNRPAKWYHAFYTLFDELLDDTKHGTKKADFEDILNSLYKSTGQIEPSFSSKLLHTFKPDMPIWDSIILKSLGLEPSQKKDHSKKVKEDVKIYNEICKQFSDHLNDLGVQEALKKFDSKFPQYKGEITETKKLDFILWSNRTSRYASVLDLSKAKDELDKMKNSKKGVSHSGA